MQLSRRTDHVETWSPPYVSSRIVAVIEIRHVPLDKRFSSRLPKELRATFKKLVDAVRADGFPPNRR